MNEANLLVKGFPGGSDGKESACSAGNMGLIPGLGRSPGEGNGNPLQYSCLGNPMDGGAWQATVHGVAQSQTRLSSQSCLIPYYLFLFDQRKQKRKELDPSLGTTLGA